MASSITLLDATDLNLWANRRGAQDQLPELIRRLVHATVDGVIRSSFPSAEGVQLGGWDGRLVVQAGSAFVPEGHSVWEMGTTKDIKGKADSDYEKRTTKPADVDPSTTTFIFVTPRRWGNKDEWERQRRGEGVWRDVRVYDADELAEWLELAPAVHLMFSVRLGKRPEDAEDLETHWSVWSGATSPAIPQGLLTAGREKQVQATLEWARAASTRPLSLRAESREEALAFFAATLLPAERAGLVNRVVIARTSTAWARLAASDERLLIVIDPDTCTSPVQALLKGHHVLVLSGRRDAPVEGGVCLSRLGRQAATEALVAAGLDDDVARELVKIARRSMLSFRRRLAISPELQQPRWSRPELAGVLLPALLAGAWDDRSAADRDVLSRLAGQPYPNWVEALMPWLHEPDAPIQRVGSAWFLTSREDAWSILSRFLSPELVGRFVEAAVDVLGVADEKFDQPPGQRHLLRMIGRLPTPHSSALTEGVAETLAVSAVRGAPVVGPFAPAVVERVLASANADWRVWATLGRKLHLLAEAAPDAFLLAVEQGASGDAPSLRKLFVEKVDSIFEFPARVGLLWALDVLAWSPQELGRVAHVLLLLSRLDPGAENEPLLRLRDIFLPWHPQTCASLDQRLRVLDALRSRDPARAWVILRRLIAQDTMAHDNHLPHWRDWADARAERVTAQEYGQAVDAIVERLLDDGQRTGAWSDLVELLAQLSERECERVLDCLERLVPDSLDLKARANLERQLLEHVAHHRSYAGEGWARPAPFIDRLASIYQRVEIQDPVHRCARAFAPRACLLEGLERDWKAKVERLKVLKAEAARALVHRAGEDVDRLVGDVRAVLARLEDPLPHHQLGWVMGGLSELSPRVIDGILRACLTSEVSADATFARGLVGAQVAKDPHWLPRSVGDTAAWTARQRAEMLLSVTPTLAVWDLVERGGPEVDSLYWRRVQTLLIELPASERAVTKLLDHERPFSALSLLGTSVGESKDPARAHLEFAIGALERVMCSDIDDDRPDGNLAPLIAQLLRRLEGTPGLLTDERAAAIEWGLLPILRRADCTPLALHRTMAADPGWFVELLKILYRAEDERGEESAPPDEVGKDRVERAWWVLREWRAVPTPAKLMEWVNAAREASQEVKRIGVADAHIGEMLSGSQLGTDGAFPHESVRDLIEALRNNDIEAGFMTGCFNNQGVTIRPAGEGGVQERKLAQRYAEFADRIGDRWPRTAAVLRRVSSRYASSARGEDAMADWDDIQSKRVRVPGS